MDFSTYPFGSHGYQSWGDLEILPRDNRDDETPLQKFRRLQSEVQELLENLKNVKEVEKDPNVLSGDLTLKDISHGLDGLRQKLHSLDCESWTDSLLMKRTSATDEQSLSQLQKALESKPESKNEGQKEVPSSAPSSTGITYELRCRPEQTLASEVAAFNQLQQRIRSLEILLGDNSRSSDTLSSITDNQTVCDAIQILSKKIALLDPHHLEHLESRLSSLQSKLSSLSDKKTGVEDEEDEKTVRHLLKLIQETESQRAALPSIVSRLNDLSLLEEQAVQFSAAISFIDSLQSEIVSDLKTSREDIKSMKESLSQDMTLFKKTMEDFEKRINSLK